MKTAIISLGAALALTACGPRTEVGPNGTVTVHGDNGQAVTIGKQVPANMPAYAPIYAGASVASTMGSASGGVVVYTVQAPPDSIVDFYKKAATGAQLTAQFDSSSMNGANAAHRVLMFGQPGSKRSLSVTVEPQSNGLTKVGLIYGAS